MRGKINELMPEFIDAISEECEINGPNTTVVRVDLLDDCTVHFLRLT